MWLMKSLLFFYMHFPVKTHRQTARNGGRKEKSNVSIYAPIGTFLSPFKFDKTFFDPTYGREKTVAGQKRNQLDLLNNVSRKEGRTVLKASS